MASLLGTNRTEFLFNMQRYEYASLQFPFTQFFKQIVEKFHSSSIFVEIATAHNRNSDAIFGIELQVNHSKYLYIWIKKKKQMDG